MKYTISLFVLPLFLLMIAIKPSNVSRSISSLDNNADTTRTYAVVELFTSEGCSSCPAADKVLAELNNRYKNKIITLGFHVDYWNRLGWKDRFSDASFSNRQRQYANAIPSSQVYTPQAIVDGKEEMVGSDKVKLTRVVENSMQPVSAPTIKLAVVEQAHSIQVSYSFEKAPNRVLNIALLQTDATTQVKSGENAGLTLHHVNVVRDFKTVSEPGGIVELKLADNIAAKDFKVVGYTQDKNTMYVSGSTGYITVK